MNVPEICKKIPSIHQTLQFSVSALPITFLIHKSIKLKFFRESYM